MSVRAGFWFTPLLSGRDPFSSPTFFTLSRPYGTAVYLFHLSFSRAVLGGVAVGAITVAALGWRAYEATSELLHCLGATSHSAF